MLTGQYGESIHTTKSVAFKWDAYGCLVCSQSKCWPKAIGR